MRDTDGVVLTYNGDPAMAAFHAISGGMTESAEDVWGQAVPYLVEVESPGEEDAVKFSETVEFDRASLRETLLAAYPDASLGDDPAAWLTDVARSPAGMIKSASLGGVTVGGMELRMLLGLNSADFFRSKRTATPCASQRRVTATAWDEPVRRAGDGARRLGLRGNFIALLSRLFVCVLGKRRDTCRRLTNMIYY